MKALILLVVGVCLGSALSSTLPALRRKECGKGPSYWCQNLTAAADCHAVPHCIQTVWVHKTLPPDNSNICSICLDMVKQARDQLESNETQELIKQVFEGSCALLHIKPIVKECDTIADDYIPELIDTLASEMNPQIVCSVAGLCNNARIQELTAAASEPTEGPPAQASNPCDSCHTVVGIMEENFDKKSRDEVLQGFLRICRRAGSFSDACSNIVITYFSKIYARLQESFNANEVCLLAGECSAMFHTHTTKIKVTPMSHVGYVSVESQKDDLPCELCVQLVGHLRDLLVANTTVDEFKRVLEGICNQTGSFAKECLGLVDQYYTFIYSFLVSELNGTSVCELADICPAPGVSIAEDVPIMPLLPVETAHKAVEIVEKNKPTVQIDMALEGSAMKVMTPVEQAQLPIERIMPPHSLEVVYNQEACTFCEYFLHYVQQAITDPATEEEIKKVVDRACNELPSTVNATCLEFIDTYGPAFVAILAQEIDPSTVCPLIRVCPAKDSKDVEVFMHQEVRDGSSCPLCLFAVTRLEEMVKDKKTEADIRQALGKLCSHLSENLSKECNDFVQTYTDELIEMLAADLTPQQVCVYIKLCTDDKPASGALPSVVLIGQGQVETNVIPDNTYNGDIYISESSSEELEVDGPQCILCEFIMKEIEDRLKNKNDEEEIKRLVHDVCNFMPKTIKTECNNYVNQYGDTIIQLLIAALEPNEVCSVMNMCATKKLEIKSNVFECATCETLIEAMDKVLENPNVDHDIEHVLEKSCRALPFESQKKCKDIINRYGDRLFDLVSHLSDRQAICSDLGMCGAGIQRIPRDILVGTNPCTYGPSYWCKNKDNASKCGTTSHCEEKVWGQRDKRDSYGSDPCTWGPSYWCQSVENANKCGASAHCQEKVWKN